MEQKVIRLTEKELHNIIKESVQNIINEIGDTPKGQYMLGRLQAKQFKQNRQDDSRETSKYANRQIDKKFGNRTQSNMQDYDVATNSNYYGFRDEKNPQLTRDMLSQNNNNSNYEANVRNNHLKGVSKF